MWCWPSILHFTLPTGWLLKVYMGGIGGLPHARATPEEKTADSTIYLVHAEMSVCPV
jgi:hypothetical protein